MVWPFLTIFIRQRLDVPLTTVGLLLSINSLAGLLTTFVAGPVADRFGRKGVMLASLAGNGILYLAMTQASTLPQWGILMVVMGGLGPLFRVGSNAMVADLIPPDDRASAYALLRMSNNLGIAIGPAIGGFVAAVSYSSAFLAAVAGYFLFAILLALFVKETLASDTQTTTVSLAGGGYGPLLRDRSFLAFCGIVTLAVIPASIMMVLLPVYAKEQHGVVESQYGFIMATNAVMVVLFQYSVTLVTKRFPSLPVMAIGALLYGVGVGSVALGTSFGAFLVSMIIMTLGELVMVPTGTTLAANLSPPDMRGRYMGIYGLTWGAGMGIGPALGGYLNDSLSPVAIWYGAFIFGLVATLGFLLLWRKLGEPGPGAQQMVAAAK
jgi:MFS family permease